MCVVKLSAVSAAACTFFTFSVGFFVFLFDVWRDSFLSSFTTNRERRREKKKEENDVSSFSVGKKNIVSPCFC